MSDLAMRARLQRLRETDVTGVFASDRSTEGSDPHGDLSVTVDPTNRVTAVVVHHIAPLRDPQGLADAVEAAYAAALGARWAAETASPPAGGRPVPVARRVERITAVRRPTHRGPDEPREPLTGAPRPRLGPVEGRSDNDCVAVVLDPAGSRGTVSADPGWLQMTTASRLAAAVTEAYTAAYEERDRP